LVDVVFPPILVVGCAACAAFSGSIPFAAKLSSLIFCRN
jgi:hypothetical protein